MADVIEGPMEQHPILGWIPSTPEPFWVRNWRTLWRWRAACYGCKIMFRSRGEHDRHWVTTHAGKERFK